MSIEPTEANIRAALSYCSPDVDHDTWFQLLAAIKDALGEAGRDIADSWSQCGHGYDPATFRDTWKSIKPGRGITVATLFHHARGNGWSPETETSPARSEEQRERDRQRREREEMKRQKAANTAKAAAALAAQIWAKGDEVSADHPYLRRKHVEPVNTLRVIQADKAEALLGYAPQSKGTPLQGQLLLVPIKIDGQLSTLELIDESGCKSALAGGAKRGGYWAAQNLPATQGDGLTVLIGEGVATVLSARGVSGHPAVATLSAGNLLPVAQDLKKRYPKAHFLILGDIGGGLKKAEQAAIAIGASLASPDFSGLDVTDNDNDFNDLARLAGADIVAEQLSAALAQGRAMRSSAVQPTGSTGSTQPSAQDADWPEPIVPSCFDLPDIPATVLPGWIGDMVGAVAGFTQTPTALGVMAALSTLAAAVQRQFEVAPFGDAYRETLSLWTISCARSGSRKSAVLDAFRSPLDQWEKEQHARLRSEVTRIESIREVTNKRIEHLKKKAGSAKDLAERERIQTEIQQLKEQLPAEVVLPRLTVGDVTTERLQDLLAEQDGQMTVLTDEGGIFQIMSGQYNGGRASFDAFLQAYTGSAMRVERSGRHVYLDRPALSFGLALQPEILAEIAATKRFRGAGLLARFIYALPKSNVGQRNLRERRSIPEAIKNNWDTNIFQLLDGIARPLEAPRVIPFSPDAQEIWVEFSEEIERQQGEGRKFEAIADWTAKLPGTVARIAALIDLSIEGTAISTVSEASVEKAVTLARLLIPHTMAAFSLMGASKDEENALAILRWIKANRLLSFTRREAQKAMESRFRSTEQLKDALAQLADWDCISNELSHYPQGGKKGGRPSIYYRVNPKLHRQRVAA